MVKRNYNEEFKKSAVKALLTPGSGGGSIVASKFDVAPSTLHSWKQKYAKTNGMKKPKKCSQWSPEQKLEIVIQSATMAEQELGEFLRANGLHLSDLEALKKECLPLSSSKGRSKLDPEVFELRKQNKALKSDIKYNLLTGVSIEDYCIHFVINSFEYSFDRSFY
jgi:transposase-like protein